MNTTRRRKRTSLRTAAWMAAFAAVATAMPAVEAARSRRESARRRRQSASILASTNRAAGNRSVAVVAATRRLR
jgi:hypothetical protein